jgi:hypothetical protein
MHNWAHVPSGRRGRSRGGGGEPVDAVRKPSAAFVVSRTPSALRGSVNQIDELVRVGAQRLPDPIRLARIGEPD